jgi:hypothetical protein
MRLTLTAGSGDSEPAIQGRSHQRFRGIRIMQIIPRSAHGAWFPGLYEFADTGAAMPYCIFVSSKVFFRQIFEIATTESAF